MRLAQPIETKWRIWLRGVDLNHRPLGYEPNELPDCSTPHFDHKQCLRHRQTSGSQQRYLHDGSRSLRTRGYVTLLYLDSSAPHRI